MAHDFYPVVSEGVRTLFLLVVPLVGGIALAGMLSGVLQGATSIEDPAISYGARLLGLVLVLYALFSSFASSLVQLAERALG